MAKPKKQQTSYHGLPIEAIIEQVNSKYGDNTLIRADMADGLEISFISTGVHALDFALGGGIPEKRITQIQGPFSSLKSTVTLSTCRQFQLKHKDGIVVYVDVEHTWAKSYTMNMGLDLKRVIIGNPDSGEQTVDVVTELLDLGVPVLMVVDSIAAITPSGELEASADQQFIGTQARLINRLMRVAVARMKRDMYDSSTSSATVIVINQEREKVGVMFGDPTVAPGGKGKDFAISVGIRLYSSPSDRIMDKVIVNGIEREIRFGQTVKFNIKKNKCSSSQHENGSFQFFARDYKHYKGLSFDNDDILFRYGVYYNIIKPDGKQYKCSFASKSYAEPAFRQMIAKDPVLTEKLYGAIIAAQIKENGGALVESETYDVDADIASQSVEEDEDAEASIPAPKLSVKFKKKKRK